MSLMEVSEKSGININDFIVIYICREPYSQIISSATGSLFKYNKYINSNYQNIDIKNELRLSLTRHLEIVKNNMQRVNFPYQTQSIVLRYENLQDDLNALLNMLGYGSIDLPHAKKSSRDKNINRI